MLLGGNNNISRENSFLPALICLFETKVVFSRWPSLTIESSLMLDMLVLVCNFIFHPVLVVIGFCLFLSKRKEEVDSVYIHEAGHAVVTHALGREFTAIRVNHHGVRGEVEGLALTNPTVADHLDTIRIYMAGSAACQLFIGGRFNNYEDEAFYDNQQIAILMRNYPEMLDGKSEAEFLHTLRYETNNLLQDNANKVRELAKTLETNSSMTYAESMYILK